MKYNIKRIIFEFNPNKAHGHDMISIRMLKMFGAIIETLFRIFKNCIECGMTGKKTLYLYFKKATNKTSTTIFPPLFF